MMEYELFKKVIAERIMDYLPKKFRDYFVELKEIKKINEKKDALILRKRGEDGVEAIPILYLDDMYNIFCEDEDLDLILEFGADMIARYSRSFPGDEIKLEMDKIGECIIPVLINTAENRELLEDVPHRDILDMSLVYRLLVQRDESGFDSMLITNNVFGQLNVSEDELFDRAKQNLRNLLPVNYYNIGEDENGQEYQRPPKVFTLVTSKGNILGAAYMLYEDLMMELSEKLNCERIFVIPLSRNEFGVVPAKVDALESLVDFLCFWNSDVNNDFLSKTIYAFSAKTKELSKAATYKQALFS